MLDLMGADQKTDIRALTSEVMKQLDSGHDGRVSKEEFIRGVQANYALRLLIYLKIRRIINNFNYFV
jgi:hypothetical protein